MPKTAQKIKASTQKFTQIESVVENIVVLTGHVACLVIEVQATNFSLLSQEEQLARVTAYASLLNSLSFPIQIVIRNKKVDISSYIKLLEEELLRAKTQKISSYIQEYKTFVQNLIKVNSVLDKKFYMVISSSSLELGAKGGIIKTEDFIIQATANLRTKSETLLTQLKKLSLQAKVLEKEELVKLLFELFNGSENALDPTHVLEDIKNPIVKGVM